jgi:hypothetical protein
MLSRCRKKQQAGAERLCAVQTGEQSANVLSRYSEHAQQEVFFSRIKRPELGVNHPLLSSCEVKERVELYLYSPSGPSWPIIG